MPPSSSVVLSGQAIDRMLRSESGLVAKLVVKVCGEAVELTRMKIRPGSVGAGPNYGRRGHLRDSYVYRILPGAEGWVGSPLPQSVFVEVGTRPHIIRPRKAKALRFYSVRIAGARGLPPAQAIYARVVHHPGTKGQYPLTRGVMEALAQNTRRY